MKHIVNNILFIRGFNTDNIYTRDVYCHIYTVLSQNNTVTYFNYSPNDDILQTYNRLCNTIHNTRFTHLIGHSMGGGLLMKYISDYSNKIAQYKAVILLMPLLYKVPLNNLIAKIPFIRNIRAPKALILPASKLYKSGNILNDNYNFISVSQISDMYNYIMLTHTDFVYLLNKHKNTLLFYAKDEAFNTIPANILKKINNKVIVNGLHECFNDFSTSREFFDKFLPLLQ
jgi:pimeloyl-ACP methyl ester carboxylesterase